MDIKKVQKIISNAKEKEDALLMEIADYTELFDKDNPILKEIDWVGLDIYIDRANDLLKETIKAYNADKYVMQAHIENIKNFLDE